MNPPHTRHEGPDGKEEAQLHSPLLSALDVNSQSHIPATFFRKKNRYSFKESLMGPRISFVVSRDENISDRDLNYGPSGPHIRRHIQYANSCHLLNSAS